MWASMCVHVCMDVGVPLRACMRVCARLRVCVGVCACVRVCAHECTYWHRFQERIAQYSSIPCPRRRDTRNYHRDRNWNRNWKSLFQMERVKRDLDRSIPDYNLHCDFHFETLLLKNRLRMSSFAFWRSRRHIITTCDTIKIWVFARVYASVRTHTSM